MPKGWLTSLVVLVFVRTRLCGHGLWLYIVGSSPTSSRQLGDAYGNGIYLWVQLPSLHGECCVIPQCPLCLRAGLAGTRLKAFVSFELINSVSFLVMLDDNFVMILFIVYFGALLL